MSRRYRSKKSLIASDLFDFASLLVAGLFKKVFNLLYCCLGKYLFFAAFNVLAFVITAICLEWQLDKWIFMPILLWFCFSIFGMIIHHKDIGHEDDIREAACQISPFFGSAYCLGLIFYQAFSIS